MPEGMTAQQFQDADGVEDWRMLGAAVCAFFRTGSFTAGTELVGAIGKLAGAGPVLPDVDLRPSGVTVQLTADGEQGLGQEHAELARQISAAARALSLPADPTALQDVQITIDALVAPEVMPFWRALLGYQEKGDEDLIDPHSRGPSFWFQEMDRARPQRNRIHLDVWVPDDQAESRVAAALAAGGRLVTDEHAPSWWVLADAEGNEACVACWLGRD